MISTFEPKLRDKAIETICSNLVMSGDLLPEAVGRYMACIVRLSDTMLAQELMTSQKLLEDYYAKVVKAKRN